jgi:flagellar biosynthesis/type III secretory pathway ATPase
MTLLEQQIGQVAGIESKEIRGQVESVRGLTVRVADFPAPVDSTVVIEGDGGSVPGQVVGFGNGSALVMSLGRLEGIAPGNTVRMTTGAQRMICSPTLV